MRIAGIIGLWMVAGGLMAGELTVEEGGLTPQGALEVIRAAKAAGNKDAWTVRVKAGSYLLDRALVFEPQDSGTPDAPVIWEGKDAVVSGGTEITGWKEIPDGVWEADAPHDAKGAPIYFESLYVDGRRAQRARMPNEGFFTPAKVTQAAVTSGVNKAVSYVNTLTGRTNDLAFLASVPKEELAYGQLLVHHNWNSTRRVLRGFDAALQTITTTADAPWPDCNPWSASSLYYIENVRAAFDAPGEWFYDGAAGKVLYRPLPGERMEKGCPLAFWRSQVKVVAPTMKLGQLVEFKGDFLRGKFVHDIQFKNLTFAYSDAVDGMGAPGPTQVNPLQAARNSGGTILADGARQLRFEGCTVMHTGNYGFWFRNGCMSNVLERCTIEDAGVGGVRIGSHEGTYLPKIPGRVPFKEYGPASTAFNKVDSCVIHHCGRFNAEGVGVFIAHASDNVVTHNDISDLYYSGVSVGWVWGFAGSVAQRNTIAFNRIHQIGQAQLADMGGVYTLGTSFGTCVSNNVIYGVDSYSYGGWGLYTDGGSEGVVLENNLVWDTKDGSFHQDYGVGNILRNNILYGNREGPAVRFTYLDWEGTRSSFAFEGNVVVTRGKPMVQGTVVKMDGAWKNNLWFNEEGKADFGGMDFAAWQKAGKETGGMEFDPKFENPAKSDFRLRPDSPAFNIHFKPFDASKAGLYKEQPREETRQEADPKWVDSMFHVVPTAGGNLNNSATPYDGRGIRR